MKSFLVLGFALALALAASSAGADDTRLAGELAARLSCAPAAGPGRVFCQVDLGAREGRVVWGDALVTTAPGSMRPLRARVAARPDSNGAPGLVAKLALVATEPGQGSLQVLARAVVCQSHAEGELCIPLTARLDASLVVGAP